MTSHITLVGGGIYPQRHMTVEGLEAVRSAAAVFHTHFPDATQWLTQMGAKATHDVSYLYRSGGNDRDNYERMTNAVISAAQEVGHVAYLEAGHPWLGVTATQSIAKLAAEPGVDITVTMVPGISSFDTVMIDAQLDPVERGCLVVDSNRLLLFRFDLDPRLGLLIYHPSSVGTSLTNFSQPWAHNRLHLLAEYLVEALGADRPFVAIRSASSSEHGTTLLEGLLGDLASQARLIDYGTTLYVPPPAPSGVDRDYLELLLSR